MLATAMGGDEGTYVEAQLLIMERSGYPEETYYTFSYSPVPGDDGKLGGIICANTDDTQRVIGQRQLALLRELAAAGSESRTLTQVYNKTEQALATNPRDLPFAAIYFAEPDGESLLLVGSTPLGPLHSAFPTADHAWAEPTPWPFAEVIGSEGGRAERLIESDGLTWAISLRMPPAVAHPGGDADEPRMVRPSPEPLQAKALRAQSTVRRSAVPGRRGRVADCAQPGRHTREIWSL